MSRSMLVILALCSALSACGNSSESPSAATDGSSPTPGVATVETVGTNGVLHATHPPASCESAVVATLRWDVTSVGVPAVEIWVQDVNEPTLFAAEGATGSAQTGPWTRPGTQFMLRAQKDGSELDRLVIDGQPCP